MENSSCTEDRIQHVLERCLSDLGLDTPHKQLWNAGLCINRWCLEELVKRDPHNFLILLQKILRKTTEVLLQCQYELVVPLSLLFSSTLLKAPYVAPDCDVLQKAYMLFYSFLSWPEPCCSASKRLLNIIHQELRAPGISFQRLVKTEQGLSSDIYSAKTMTVLLVNPDEDVPPEVQSISEKLSSIQQSNKDVTVTLILHSFQATLGTKHDLGTLRTVLQKKQSEELQQILETVTLSMETAAISANLSTARRVLTNSMEKLRESLSVPAPDDNFSNTSAVETFVLPPPKCHSRPWENDNFDILHDLLTSDLDSLADCFLKAELDEDDNDTSVDEEDEFEGNSDHRISTASSSSRDSTFSSYSLSSSWSVPSCSSGVESDFSEDTEEGQGNQPKPRRKPKKKSKSLLGIERFSMLFKTPRSPSACRRAQSMGYQGDYTKDFQRTKSALKSFKYLNRHVRPLQPFTATLDPLFPQRPVCIRRRPILSCDDSDVAEVPTLIKVVIFGGDKEAGRLARAYSDLQLKESKCPRLTKTCKLQFYLVPSRRRYAAGSEGNTAPGGQAGSSNKTTTSGESNGVTLEDSTGDIAQMLGMMDPWYERNVLSLLSLSSDVLCQAAYKEGDVSERHGGAEQLPLLADLVLYYCRHADQPVLVQLYQVELTMAGGERRREVFIHSLELGHSAGIRAVRAMGAASKRFGINEEREAVPLTLSIAYNKVAVSGRSQWTQAEVVCTSINVYKACRTPEQLDSRTESLQLTVTEVLKKQSKSKKSYNQHISMSEVKVDKVQVMGGDRGTTFAVCLDQDQKKFIQSVTRCDVSLCCKAGSSSDWRSYKPLPGQVQPLHPSYCSLLCLPITSFSASAR